MFGIAYAANGLYVYKSWNSEASLLMEYIQIVFGRSQGIFIALYQYIVKRSSFTALWNIFQRRRMNRKEISQTKISFFSKFVGTSSGFTTFIGEEEYNENESFLI